MFERFTDRARQAIVFAQEEARELQHNYIGTEHLLLGLFEGDGIAAKALANLGVEKKEIRAAVVEEVGSGPSTSPAGHIPFTPRAKKAMEMALRQALAWGHNYIGTEHLLIGLVRDDGGLAAKLLAERNVDPEMVTREVLELLKASGGAPKEQSRSSRMPSWNRRRAAARSAVIQEPVDGPVCPGCGLGLGDNLAADVIPAVGPIERIFVVAYCRGCGHTLNVLPDD